MSDLLVKRPPWHYGVPVLANFTSVLLSFLSRIVLARLIGPAAFGLFAVWQNNVQLFGTIGTFGQQNYVLKELAHATDARSDEARRVALATVKLTLLASAVVGALGAGFFLLFQHGTAGAAVLQCIGAMTFALLMALSAVHRGLGALLIGVMFDRLIYQILFIVLLTTAGTIIASNMLALEIYAAVMLVAVAASIGYLFVEIGTHISAASKSHDVLGQARRVVPFFVVSSLFAVNARYLLGYCGIFLQGAVLGQIGLVFTTVAIMIIPTSTLNLVFAPILARRLLKPRARRVVFLYLAGVLVLILTGVLMVFLAHPLIFGIARIELTIAGGFVLLLCTAFGVTILGNAVLIIEQLRGRATEAARIFSVAMAAKLILGYWIADHYGITALLWMDLIIGLLFVASVMTQLFRSPDMYRHDGASGADAQ